jgi:hypothetical protein
MAAAKKQSNLSPAWIAGGAVLVLVISAAIYLNISSENKRTADDEAADRILRICAGGATDKIGTGVRAGLSRYLADVHANTGTTHSTLGAVTEKITPDNAGVALYKVYQQCVREQTIAYLWHGNIPPSYRESVEPAPDVAGVNERPHERTQPTTETHPTGRARPNGPKTKNCTVNGGENHGEIYQDCSR